MFHPSFAASKTDFPMHAVPVIQIMDHSSNLPLCFLHLGLLLLLPGLSPKLGGIPHQNTLAFMGKMIWGVPKLGQLEIPASEIWARPAINTPGIRASSAAAFVFPARPRMILKEEVPISKMIIDGHEHANPGETTHPQVTSGSFPFSSSRLA